MDRSRSFRRARDTRPSGAPLVRAPATRPALPSGEPSLRRSRPRHTLSPCVARALAPPTLLKPAPLDVAHRQRPAQLHRSLQPASCRGQGPISLAREPRARQRSSALASAATSTAAGAAASDCPANSLQLVAAAGLLPPQRRSQLPARSIPQPTSCAITGVFRTCENGGHMPRPAPPPLSLALMMRASHQARNNSSPTPSPRSRRAMPTVQPAGPRAATSPEWIPSLRRPGPARVGQPLPPGRRAIARCLTTSGRMTMRSHAVADDDPHSWVGTWLAPAAGCRPDGPSHRRRRPGGGARESAGSTPRREWRR
jgi:hypothetical protein